MIEEIIAFPDAKPSLDFRNHFELWLRSCCRPDDDAAVNKVTPVLFEAYPSPQDMAMAAKQTLLNIFPPRASSQQGQVFEEMCSAAFDAL